MIDVFSTGRISSKPLERPPSNRISATATMPAWRASSKSSKSIQPSPSEPISMPEAEHQHEAGQAETPRREGGRETRRQQEAGEQEELTLVQGWTLPDSCPR